MSNFKGEKMNKRQKKYLLDFVYFFFVLCLFVGYFNWGFKPRYEWDLIVWFLYWIIFWAIFKWLNKLLEDD